MSVAVSFFSLLFLSQVDSHSASRLQCNEAVAHLCEESPLHPFLDHNPSPSSTLLAACGSETEECKSKDDKQSAGLTVIGAGFMKTGTKSIERALQLLGHKVYDFRDIWLHCHTELWVKAAYDWKHHGDMNGMEKVIHEIEALGYTATLDFPLNLFALAFADLRPNARVLFSVRDSEEKWISSGASYFRQMAHLLCCRPWTWLFPIMAEQRLAVPQILNALGVPAKYGLSWEHATYAQLSRPLPWFETVRTSPLDDKTFTAELIRFHRNLQRELEEHLVDGQLLIYNVKQGWDPLLNFLGVAEDECIHRLLTDEEFPHVNDGAQSQRLMTVLNMMALGLPLCPLFAVWILSRAARILYRVGKRFCPFLHSWHAMNIRAPKISLRTTDPMPFQRRLSGVERMWLGVGDVSPPFANQLVIEGTGVLNFEAWKVAVAEAAAVNPGSRLKLHGHLWWTRWVDSGYPPPVVVVDGSAWDGQSEIGANFLARPLPPETGPTCEILLVTGRPTPRVIIRSHHAVMDGRGHTHFAHDIFRCLRGELPLGAAATTTDEDVGRMFNVSALGLPQADITAIPTGRSHGEATGLLWRRRFVPGRHSRLLPRAIVALAEAARENTGNPSAKARFVIPVDLRRHLELASCPENRSTANITGSLLIDITEVSTTEEVQLEMKRQLESYKEVHSIKGASLFHVLPRSFVRRVHLWDTEKHHSLSQWSDSGGITNLGKVDVDGFRAGDFCGQRCFFIPPATEGFPFIMSMTGITGGVELCVTQPCRLGDNGRLERCLDKLVASLTGHS